MRRFFCFILSFSLCAAALADSSAPSFSLQDAGGKTIEFPRKQQGVDIYFFWASWCPYCKALMPQLQSMLDEYGSNIEVFAFNIRDDEDPAEYLNSYGYSFTLMPEADGVMPLYGVKGTPGIFLVDSKGAIRLNLYTLNYPKNNLDQNMKHSQKAARKAPWWAARIREEIDLILAEANSP